MSTLYTTGINPFFRTTDAIYQELQLQLLPQTNGQVSQIYFYGAGIINEEKAAVIRLALQPLFPSAQIELFSDVVAASRSLFGSREGIACILGTGSNACLYDGEKVVTGISPLGFILGDEGSGAVLGRKLLGDYFKLVMPADLRQRFDQKFHLSREEALQRVYKTEKPNHFLASFVPFLSQEIGNDYSRQMVLSNFADFFERNVTKIPDYHRYQIGFTGSVAYHFRELVEQTCAKFEMQCISIQQEPMEGLIKYHLNKNI